MRLRLCLYLLFASLSLQAVQLSDRHLAQALARYVYAL